MRLFDRRYTHGKSDQSTTTVVHRETDPVFLASDTFPVGGDLDCLCSESGPPGYSFNRFRGLARDISESVSGTAKYISLACMWIRDLEGYY